MRINAYSLLFVLWLEAISSEIGLKYVSRNDIDTSPTEPLYNLEITPD